jgi:hypothetical protein
MLKGMLEFEASSADVLFRLARVTTSADLASSLAL